MAKHLTETRCVTQRSYLARLSEPSCRRRRMVLLQTSSPPFQPPPPLSPVIGRFRGDKEQSVHKQTMFCTTHSLPNTTVSTYQRSHTSFSGLYLYYGSLLENVSHSFSHTVYFCSTTIHPLMECSILVPIILAYSDWSGFAGLSRHPPLSLRSSSASAFAVTDRRCEQRSVNVVNMQNWQR